jgi:hypothetical protein
MKPVITAPGESLPGAGVSGATTVTLEPSADAQDGAELDEQPASRAAVPQASTAAPAFAIFRLLIM